LPSVGKDRRKSDFTANLYQQAIKHSMLKEKYYMDSSSNSNSGGSKNQDNVEEEKSDDYVMTQQEA